MYSKSGHSSFNDFQPHSAKKIGSGPRGSEDSLFFVTCNDPEFAKGKALNLLLYLKSVVLVFAITWVYCTNTYTNLQK